MRRFAVLFLVLIALSVPAVSRSRHRRSNNNAASTPGSFDYWVLSLSWSPDFCATHPDGPECGGTKRFAFIVHGLWPQNERGYPKGCGGPAFDPGQLPAGLRDLMPSDPLIQHEWQDHGTCSGMGETAYFQQLENADAKIHVPNDFRQPLKQINIAPADIRQKFVQANPGSAPESFAIECGGNRFLTEVRVCLTKDLKSRACGSDVRDTCTAPEIIMRPLR